MQYSALAGGAMIGLAALVLYGTLGKIAGVSGITFAALDAEGRHWRIPFLGGLVAGGWLAALLGAAAPVAALPASASGIALVVAAGLLVGAGTRLANGCTSGHGICGLSRLSARSLAAVAVFMAMGMITATFIRKILWS